MPTLMKHPLVKFIVGLAIMIFIGFIACAVNGVTWAIMFED